MKKPRKRPTFAQGYEAGYKQGIGKRTEDQCCCVFDEADEIIQLCAVHKEWIDKGMKRGTIEVPKLTTE